MENPFTSRKSTTSASDEGSYTFSRPAAPEPAPAPVIPAEAEKTPAEKGAATKKRNARKAAKVEAKADAASRRKQLSLKDAAEQVVTVLRGPDGGSTADREAAFDALEVALGRDPSDEGREFSVLVESDPHPEG